MIDTSGANSILRQANVNSTGTLQASATESADNMQSQGNQLQTQASNVRSSAFETAYRGAQDQNKRQEVTSRLSKQDQQTYDKAYSNVERASAELSQRYGLNTTGVSHLGADARIKWDSNQALLGKAVSMTTGFSAGGNVSTGINHTTAMNEAKDDIERILTDNNVSQSYKTLSSLTSSSEKLDSDGHTSSRSSSVSAKLDEASRMETQSSEYLRSESAYRKAAQLVESEGFHFTQDQQQAYVEYLQKEKGMSVNQITTLQQTGNQDTNALMAREFIHQHADTMLQPYLAKVNSPTVSQKPALKRDYQKGVNSLQHQNNIDNAHVGNHNKAQTLMPGDTPLSQTQIAQKVQDISQSGQREVSVQGQALTKNVTAAMTDNRVVESGGVDKRNLATKAGDFLGLDSERSTEGQLEQFKSLHPKTDIDTSSLPGFIGQNSHNDKNSLQRYQQGSKRQRPNH